MHSVYALILALIASTIIYVDGQPPVPPVIGLDANFMVNKIQGATCVSPCAVQFIGTGAGTVAEQTVDTAYPRPFHTLRYEWDFGDPNSGSWAYGAAAEAGLPSPKNRDLGPMAGHVYENSGTYTVTLTVTNPAGNQSVETKTVAVVDPATQFSAANTFCFATDDLDWNGCPLDCTTDDNCTVVDGSPTFAQAIASGDDCAGVGAAGGDCANADPGGGKRRIYLRRGDTFTVGGSLIYLLQDDTTPGLVEAFGTGALPHIDASGGGEFSVGTSWTISHMHYTRLSGIRMPAQADGGPDIASGRRDGTTWFASDVNYGLNWIDAQAATGFLRWTERVAFIDMRFIATTVGGAENYAAFMAFDYALLMGVSINNGSPAIVNPTGGPYATLRTNHLSYALFAHNSWRGAASGHEHMQIRAWDNMDPSVYGQDVEDNRYNVFRESLYEEPGNAGNYGDRFCVDSGCNCSQGGCGPGHLIDAGHIVDAKDFIYEDNLWRCDTRSSPTPRRFAILSMEGGSHTIRNNTFDLQNCATDGLGTGGIAIVAATGEPQLLDPVIGGSSVDGNVLIYNNTVFADHAYSENLQGTRNVGLQNSGCPDSNCYFRNNLVVWPNYTGVTTLPNLPGYTSSGNRFSTTEALFSIGTVPEMSLTQLDDFRIVATVGASFARDAGYTWNVVTDAARYGPTSAPLMYGRPVGAWDQGAWEYGATDIPGREFHVASTGSNSNPGTLDQPWLTITHALSQVGASDTLWIHAGTWTEAISTDTQNINGGSSWATKLLIAAWPGDTVILRPASGSRVVFLADSGARYIEFRDIDFDGVNVTSDVVKITWTGTSANVAGHIRFRGGQIHNAGDGVTVDDLDQGVLVSDGDFNEFIGVEIHHNGEVANKDHGIYISTDDNLVEDCNIHDNAATGVEIFDGTAGAIDPDRNMVRRNLIHNNGTAGSSGEGVELCGTSNVVTLNEIYSNQADGVLVFDDDSVTCNAVGITVQYNWVYTNGGGSVVDDVDAAGSILTPNRLAAP